MSVYVDDARIPYGRMLMCHMVADTREELLEMAAKIGVDHKWIQHEGTSREHFDVCLSKRDLALENGALRASSKDIVRIIRRKRSTIL